ncbi:helix-turn-helix domain-containing protein [Umezawaea sp. NPDC059074]|uniref:helix-turn-helix domain-containing protein n=1 Tax=Umezawaea sp. NPDC059074 TaxID=3346716 RepID=UPI0036CDB5D5
MGVITAESYLELPPVAELRGVVRTVWVQRVGAVDYVQRHLPTGGVELHFPLGGWPRLVGPLTGPVVEVVPAGTTLVGVRFHPGAAPPLGALLDELVDRHLSLEELWGRTAQRLADVLAGIDAPGRALHVVQAHLVREFRRSGGPDPLVGATVDGLMPWRPVAIDGLAEHLALSTSQLRRRCLRAVGLSPKELQRTLRFQGFLALAQARATASGRRGVDGVAGLAVDVGYSDQAHLSRECLRLTGLTPGQLLGGDVDRCACGHDHSASYGPFLATRRMRDSFKTT